MRRAPGFSVVIPTYNRLEFLKQALSSVWAQSHSDYEIIVVDDGSTDGTKDYLDRLGSRVKVLCQPNRGPSAARNLGVKQAIGNYIAFLDSDDIWLSWTLATFHQLILSHQQPSLLCAAIVEFDSNVRGIKQQKLAADYFIDYLQSANDSGFVRSGALVVKKEIFDSAEGFDENMLVAEDHDLCLRLGLSRGFIRVRSPVTLAYRRHTANMSTSPKALYPAAEELLIRESAGRYPGGKRRKKERWQLLSRMLRPVAMSCLRAGLVGEAWSLYRRSFRMNVRLGRFRFLTGFALYSLFGCAIDRRRHANSGTSPAGARSPGS
jgi:glycosyltransferase involved in cell wall biosynthesis